MPALKKVRTGDPLRIAATTYNTFVDTAQDFLARRHEQSRTATLTGRQNGIVQVRNDSGAVRQRYEVLGISGPLFDPGFDEEAFKNHSALIGVMPAEDDHQGTFVVLLEPVVAGHLARAVATGVVPVQLDVPDEDYPYRLAEITDGSALNLTAAKTGSAAILWREGGVGLQWALVRLGNRHESVMFPVALTKTGGSQGTASTAASWTYTVTDPSTGQELATGVDPVADPHQWRRPSVGFILDATFGYAHWDPDGQLVLGWINEVADQEAC